MGKVINIHEARTHLSRIVAEAERLGLLKGKVKVPDDFNAPIDPELIAQFEGR